MEDRIGIKGQQGQEESYTQCLYHPYLPAAASSLTPVLAAGLGTASLLIS